MKKPFKEKVLSSFRLKFDLKMKITTFLVIVSLFQIHANNTYGQKTKVTLDLENVTIENVLDKIETLTDFKFMYNDREIDYSKLVTIKANQERVSSILKRVFLNTNVSFKLINKQIVLKIEEEGNKETNYETQQIEISGTINDTAGLPLAGVNILIVGSNTGAQSDFDGNYSIKASKGDVVEFSYVSMQTQRITIGDSNIVNITMKDDVSQLDEVVIVGYGTRKIANVSGSISTVSTSMLKSRTVRNIAEALQGAAAGLDITIGTGRATTTPEINIRGFESN